MRKVTITGWSEKEEQMVDKESFWTEEIPVYLCIARAASEVDLMTINHVQIEDNGDGE
ncbi:MAG: hypothetical protein V3T23_01840 [Nitrososphaerales archaeon]